MKLSGWGQHPAIEAEVFSPVSVAALQQRIGECPQPALIPRGLGRSYGDSALAPRVLSTARLDRFLAFDENTGVLRCSAGVSLEDILSVFVPKGWFPPVG